MICAKPGWGAPMPGQTVYVVTENGKPIAACLHLPRAMQEFSVRDPKTTELHEVPWVEETQFIWPETFGHQEIM